MTIGCPRDLLIDDQALVVYRRSRRFLLDTKLLWLLPTAFTGSTPLIARSAGRGNFALFMTPDGVASSHVLLLVLLRGRWQLGPGRVRLLSRIRRLDLLAGEPVSLVHFSYEGAISVTATNVVPGQQSLLSRGMSRSGH